MADRPGEGGAPRDVSSNDALVARVVHLIRQHFLEAGHLDADDLEAVVELTDVPGALVPRLRAALEAAGVIVDQGEEVPGVPKPSPSPAMCPASVATREDLDSAVAFVRTLESGGQHLLTASQEVRLGRIVQACGAGDHLPHGFAAADPRLAEELGRRAREVFERRNLRLVYWIARQYAGQGMEVDDLVQEGWFGLRRAVEKFDPERGLKFSTYATWWVRQAVTRALADKSRTIRLPVHVVGSLQKLMRVREKMLLEAGRVNVRELAELTGYPVGKVMRLIRLGRGPVSLESPVGDGLNVLGDLVPAEAHFEETVEGRELRRLVVRALETLPARERDVIERRFGIGDLDPQTLDEIGRSWGVTRERVRQVEAKALKHLRSRPRREPLEQFASA